MTAKRFMVDDAGTLIDMHTRDTFDYVSDVCSLLNELYEENQSLKFDNKELIRFITSKGYTLKDYIEFIGQFQSVGVNKEDLE